MASQHKENKKYGITFPSTVTQLEIELMCFHQNHSEEKGGLGRFGHLQNITNYLLNSHNRNFFIWNDWTEWIMREFCYTKEVPIAGPGGSWKTTCMAWYGLVRWYASPHNTRGIGASTTMQALRAKLWKEILHFYRASGSLIGNAVNHPQPKIQTVRGNDGAGIFGIAVEAGDVQKAVENIKGMHATNQFVLIDEATGVSEAIVDASTNLETGTEWFQLLGAGNPVSYFDSHGKLCEPTDGWSSITVESDTWKTKRGGTCIHLDGLKAPNVVLGKKKYPGMISQDDIDSTARTHGENSPLFWSQRRGFWTPEGITKTVLTQTIIAKFKATEPVIWVGDSSTKIAAADLAFEGGDKCILGFAKVGKIDDNGTIRTALCFTKAIPIKVDVTGREPIHYQIARQIREECKAEGVEPFYFAADVSGEGGGTADIWKREWSTEFHEVEFGGRASDRKVSDINPHKGWEEYVNRVTELWYSVRRCVEQHQVRGMPIEMAREFTERNYEMRGALIIVESKSKMKARIGHSPDHADMGAIMVELALTRGLLPSDTTDSPSSGRTQGWQDFAKDMTPLSEYAEA